MALKLCKSQICDGKCRIFSDILAFASSELPEEPLETICPIDQVKMANTDQSTLVVTPLTGRDTTAINIKGSKL
jgi:hypothetical protein